MLTTHKIKAILTAYNPESDVYTFDTNIAKNLNIELIDKSNHEISFLKTARKYDIISTCN